jgi:phosphohistidine phosphatase
MTVRVYPRGVQLYVMRHAEAEPGDPDDLRALTAEGRKAARTAADLFAEHSVSPDVVLTSPLLRARQTGEEIGRATGAPVEPDERLAPGATADQVRSAIAGRGETVVIVGHQPDCGRIFAELAGGEEPSFPAAAVRKLELP